MKENPPLPEQRIIEHLKTNYGIDVVTLTFLPAAGADMQASIYKAQTSNQSSYFVKLNQGNRHDISAIISAMLDNAGIQQIIPFVKTIHSQTQRLGDFILSVSPFIEGQDGFSRNLTDIQWHKLGQVMRQIHEINVPPSIQAMIRQEVYSPKWRQVVRSLYPLIDSELSGDTAAVSLRTFMKKHRSSIQRLVDRAEQLAQKAQNQSPKFVLCHSDIHGGNVLIDGNGAIYIVDWDAPIMAPKERDLMFIGGGVANVWNKPHEEECFYKGYGATEIDMTTLTYYRHERIVEDIAIYGQQLLRTTVGGEERLKLYEHFVAQFEPHGVVDIAFKTDESLTL